MRILLVIFAFLFVIFCFPYPVLAHFETAIIKMTQDGFEPQNITIDQNQTLLFVNEDKVDRWPASNIHPTHDIYPEFDPKKPIPPGQSWTFKPKSKGEWKYHDHLLPHQRGLIVVKSEGEDQSQDKKENGNLLEKIFDGIKNWLLEFAEKFSSSLTKSKKIPDASDFMKLSADDQQKALKDLAKVKGADYAWQYVNDTFKGQAGSSGNIHDLAHFAGGLIFEGLNFDGLSKCSPQFAFGCFHGFLDKAFQKNLDNLERAESACSSLGVGGPAASCVHGIGHGVASFYQTNDLRSSLNSCKRLTPWGQQYCFDGVFMEFERGAGANFYKEENPYYPCDEIEKEFGPEVGFACGRNQPTVLMSKFKLSFEDVIGICLASSSEQFKRSCFDALGFITTKSTSSAKEIFSSCSKIGIDEYTLRCAKAAAGELIFQEVPGWQTQSTLICRNLTQNYQEECLKYLNDLIMQYGRETASKFELKSEGEDSDSYLRRQLKICGNLGGRDDCYKEVAALFFEQFGLKQTLKLLSKNEDYPEVYSRCHEVTHFLSRAEYKRLGSIADVYAQCDSTCHGGCYHGTLEAYLKERNLGENNLKNEFVKVCGKREDHPTPLVFNECFHGLGHAAMFVTDMDLIKSLSLCDGFFEQNPKERCFTGAFMENSSSSTGKDHTSKFVKTDDPFYPCNILEEKYLGVCWRYQSSYFAILTGDNWAKVTELCLQIPNQYQIECFRTIGTNQVGFTQDPIAMRTNCELAPNKDLQNVCIIGVVSSFGYRFVGNPAKMIHFCSLVSPSDRMSCFKQIGMSFLDWSDERNLAKENCSKISDTEGKDWCLSVI